MLLVVKSETPERVEALVRSVIQNVKKNTSLFVLLAKPTSFSQAFGTCDPFLILVGPSKVLLSQLRSVILHTKRGESTRGMALHNTPYESGTVKTTENL